MDESMPPRLLKPSEAAKVLDVDTDTLRRWADAGKLWYTTTLGGLRRYSRDEIYAIRDNKQ